MPSFFFLLGALTSKLHNFAFRPWKSHLLETAEPLTPLLLPVRAEAEVNTFEVRLTPRSGAWLPDLCRFLPWARPNHSPPTHRLRLAAAVSPRFRPSLTFFREPGNIISPPSLFWTLLLPVGLSPFSVDPAPSTLYPPPSTPFFRPQLRLDCPGSPVSVVPVSPRSVWRGFRGGLGVNLSGIPNPCPNPFGAAFPGLTAHLPYLYDPINLRLTPLILDQVPTDVGHSTLVGPKSALSTPCHVTRWRRFFRWSPTSSRNLLRSGLRLDFGPHLSNYVLRAFPRPFRTYDPAA